MMRLLEKGQVLLGNGINGNSRVYRGIMELLGRFGYLSLEEVIFGYDFGFREVYDRLNYLEKAGLIQKFPSLTLPRQFYCLTVLGTQVVRAHNISDEIHSFGPSQYNPITQNHSRTLIRIFLAFRKIFGADFLGWRSERALLADQSLMKNRNPLRGPRVFDGMFLIRIHKTKHSPHLQEAPVPLGGTTENWWCGLELELTVKSTQRYRKQFKDLSDSVYNSLQENQTIPMMLYLSGSPAIQKKLMEIREEQQGSFGRCLFVFGQVDSFLRDLGKTPMTRCVGSDRREIIGTELNHVRVRVAS